LVRELNPANRALWKNVPQVITSYDGAIVNEVFAIRLVLSDTLFCGYSEMQATSGFRSFASGPLSSLIGRHGNGASIPAANTMSGLQSRAI